MKKLFKILTNKIAVTAFFFLVQIVFTVVLLLVLSSISAWVYLAFSLISLFVCLFVMGKDANPAYKLAWVVPILLFPLFGGMMYLSFGRSARLRRKERNRLAQSEAHTQHHFVSARERASSHVEHLPDDGKKLDASAW